MKRVGGGEKGEVVSIFRKENRCYRRRGHPFIEIGSLQRGCLNASPLNMTEYAGLLECIRRRALKAILSENFHRGGVKGPCQSIIIRSSLNPDGSVSQTPEVFGKQCCAGKVAKKSMTRKAFELKSASFLTDRKKGGRESKRKSAWRNNRRLETTCRTDL